MSDRKRFMVGKYEIIAQPIPNSAHRLRYTARPAEKSPAS